MTDPANALVDQIRASVIGAHETAQGPFGTKPVVYADYTASGRGLTFIEQYLTTEVLPRYANTHTESSGTGLQTSKFRQDARDIIAACVHATQEHAVLFTGSGSTAAIDKMIHVLGLRIPSNLEDDYGLAQYVTDRPVVFIGPYEHHSNELPWRESIADVVTIGEDAHGNIDLAQLEQALQRNPHRSLKIGSFSAASNVTGITTDVDAVSALLHRYDALAFWDYAAAAPYVPIRMGARHPDGEYLDAVFISPHKFIGGPGTPGLLIARRELFQNRVPTVPGGGTVAYVSEEAHDYLDDVEHREEGGTPDILGSIRAGLVFQLKEAVGTDEIRRREHRLLRRAIAGLSLEPRVEVLGSLDVDRLSVLSFVIRADLANGSSDEKYLHHNFVVAVLNDLFGVQSRGGCSCAGPYGHRLLGIDGERSHAFEREINRGCEGIKPGWTRINLNYFIDDDELDYIISAICLTARNAATLLPHYTFEPEVGLWRHRDGVGDAPSSLHDINYVDGAMVYPPHPTNTSASLAEHLEAARELLAKLATLTTEPIERMPTSTDFENLRWFPYPDEVSELT
ncbi:putative cysteine desulfurase [Nymphon striatum]|nr:putative cysteine desulfurase [Nymphon striatum]